MKNIVNVIKIATVAYAFLLSGLSSAGVASIFDDPYLVTVETGGNIIGYYASENDRFSCTFLFMGNLNKIKNEPSSNFNILNIKTFNIDFYASHYRYSQRDKNWDIPGNLFIRGNELILKTEAPHGGCNSVAGLFNGGPGDAGVVQYSKRKKINAIGIGVVNKKTFFFDKAGSEKRKGFLVVGNIVVILSRRSDYSYVRFTNPSFMISNPGETTMGWIKTNDLEDPFPPSQKQ